MEFINLKRQHRLLERKINQRISNVLHHGQYIMGPEIRELEDSLKSFTHSKHCITVSSGTDALLISMMALGIGRGDEVITSPFTFFSTVETIILTGAKPIFVDINPETFNIDEEKIEDKISSKTKAILPVSLFGQCANISKINEIASKNNLAVIEDGAQSFGSTHFQKKSCSLTTIGCTSFFPSKPLGCYGDGGAIFTNDDNLAEIIKEIRAHGQSKRYQHSRIGVNGRLDTIQAAILLEKLKVFESELSKRIEIASTYNKLLYNFQQDLKLPIVGKGNKHIYSQFSILSSKRDDLAISLKSKGIPTAIHYPIPAHKQRCIVSGRLDLHFSEKVSNEIISIPMSPYISLYEQKKVVSAIDAFLVKN